MGLSVAERRPEDDELANQPLSAAMEVDEKKLVRKLDLYLIPLVMSLYLFSFLDR